VVLRRSSRAVVVAAGARDGANRISGRTRAFRRLCRVGCDCDGGLRDEPQRYADYRLLLAIRWPTGIPSAFLARKTPCDRGFSTVSPRGFVRWNWCRPFLGSTLGCAALIRSAVPFGSNLFELAALRARLKMSHEVSMYYPSPPRKRGSRATAGALWPWIPAFASLSRRFRGNDE
jgi:hypothetical protein